MLWKHLQDAIKRREMLKICASRVPAPTDTDDAQTQLERCSYILHLVVCKNSKNIMHTFQCQIFTRIAQPCTKNCSDFFLQQFDLSTNPILSSFSLWDFETVKKTKEVKTATAKSWWQEFFRTWRSFFTACSFLWQMHQFYLESSKSIFSQVPPTWLDPVEKR